MKLDLLLYSRTLSKDFRWIIAPSLLSPQDLSFVKSFVDHFFTIKDYNIPQIDSSTYYNQLVFTKNAVLLLSCGKSQFKDSVGRPIYHVKGFAAELQSLPDLINVLGAILRSLDDDLDPWRQASFNDLDRWEMRQISLNFPNPMITNNANNPNESVSVDVAREQLREIGNYMIALGNILVDKPERLFLQSGLDDDKGNNSVKIRIADFPDPQKIANLCAILRNTNKS